MPYATATDLRARYPERDLRELTDEQGSAIDDDRLDTALADASDKIDGYLVGRYKLPIADPPRVLTQYACDLAMYDLQSLRPQSMSEDARKRYENAIAYLRDVAVGKVQLSLNSVDQPAPQSAGPVIIPGGDRTFTRDSMKGL